MSQDTSLKTWQKFYAENFGGSIFKLQKNQKFKPIFFNITDFYLIWQTFSLIMKCRKLLKTSQIFVPYETFAIIFSYECYIQTKTNQSFEYALSTKYYIYAVDMYRDTHINAGNQTLCFVRFRIKLVWNTEGYKEKEQIIKWTYVLR